MNVKVLSETEDLRMSIVGECSVDRLLSKDGGLRVSTLKNVLFDPRAGLFSGGRFIPQSFWVAHNGERMARLMESGEFQLPKPVRRHEGRVFYLGIIHSCWGHCLLDSTRFLWPVTAGRIPDDVLFAYSLAIDPGKPKPKDVVPNFRALLECAGVPAERMLRIEEPTEFAEMILADECFSYDPSKPYGHTYTPEARDMFERIAQVAAPAAAAPTRTVLLSRSKWRRNAVDFGERRVEDCIRRETGCEVVSPECLSFREMVRLLRETKRLFTTEGSIAHNAVFLPSGAELVLLLKAKEYNRYQCMVDDMRQLNVTYIDCNASDHYYRSDAIWLGPFFMHVTASLAEYLHCAPEWPRWTRFKYLLNVFFHRLYLKFRI